MWFVVVDVETYAFMSFMHRYLHFSMGIMLTMHCPYFTPVMAKRRLQGVNKSNDAT